MFSDLIKKASVAVLALSTTASAWETCIVPSGGAGVDDSQGVRDLLPLCSNNSEIIFASCTNYNISTPINFGTLHNVTITILGNLNLPQSITYVQSLVNVTGSLYWFTIAVSCSLHICIPDSNLFRASTSLSKVTKTPTKASYTHTVNSGGLPLSISSH